MQHPSDRKLVAREVLAKPLSPIIPSTPRDPKSLPPKFSQDSFSGRTSGRLSTANLIN